MKVAAPLILIPPLLVLVILFGWFTGCESMLRLLPIGDYEAQLPNGYHLVRTNSPTVFIWSPKGISTAMVVPPKIVEIGVHEALVAGRVEYSPDSDVPMEHAAGYFILDTSNGEVDIGLSEEEFEKKLKERGLADPPKLVRPRVFQILNKPVLRLFL